MNMLVWTLQGLLAVVFTLHGWLYLTMSPAREAQFQQRQPPNAKPLPKLPRWLTIFIGLTELLGAAGLLLPGLTGLFTWLTPLAAGGLMLPVVGAVGLHASRREMPQVLVTGALCALAAAVVYLRWQIVPL